MHSVCCIHGNYLTAAGSHLVYLNHGGSDVDIAVNVVFLAKTYHRKVHYTFNLIHILSRVCPDSPCSAFQRGLGHAVLQGAPVLAQEREPVLVLLGDALVSGEAPSAAMAAISRAHGGASVVGLEEVPLEKVSRYGIVKGAQVDERVWKLDDLVEKPAQNAAPSRLAIAGRYLLDPAIFDLLATQTPGHGGEIQLTDSIRRLLSEKPVYGYRYPGHRHDIGNPVGYLETLNAFSA